ncbi:hypothetical protein BN439_0828 [Erwinia amylovora Ea644]|nr:hypothetical protein BN439_0828 [Erwinia amylovora Ea644]
MFNTILSEIEITLCQEEFERVHPESEAINYEFVDGRYHSFNDLIIIPVIAIKKSIDIKDHPCVSIKSSEGVEIATLCIVSERSEQLSYISGFGDEELFCCFVDSRGRLDSSIYTFRNNYVAVKKPHYQHYLDIMDSSEYWGGFTHKEITSRQVSAITEVNVISNITAPTENHKTSMLLAIDSSSSFERFLKYYHQLELLFDVVVICKLKSLNSLNLNAYSSIIKEVNQKSELKGLHYLFDNYIHDDFIDPIVDCIKMVINHQQVAKEMFQDLGKNDNPISDDTSWQGLIELLNQDNLNKSTAANSTMPNGTKFKLMKDNDYRKFIFQLTAYWIYRVRCSIAHNRIGEYLFEYDNEIFITDFMEHLLLKVVQAINSNANLQSILTALPTSQQHQQVV